MDPALANNRYRAQLRSTFVDGVDDTLEVDSVPTNVPTIVTVGWNTIYETVFRVEGKSGDSASNYALTGVTKIRGYSGNLAEGTAVNCLNDEEFFNQWSDDITAIQEVADEALEAANRPYIVEIPIGNSLINLTTGDGQAFFRVPLEMNGMNLTGVGAVVYTAGTTNTLDIQIRNKTQAADMLSTKITIDSGETDSATANAAAVIDTSNDDVATNDVIAIDIDAVHTTPAKGLVVMMRFELP